MGRSRRTLKGNRGYYELLVPLARRELSEYHLAVNRQIQGASPWVVVRESLPHVAEDPALTQAFLAELRVTTQFAHPNLVRTLETGILGKRYFVITEYLMGEGLGAVVQAAASTGRSLTPHHAAGLLIQACTGLEGAHQTVDAQGNRLAPIHRNLTPACLVVCYDGRVKVIGFEPEGRNPGGPSESARRDVSYYSPELCQGKAIDRRSDVFSLGVILWELLAQKPLFRRVSQQGTLQAILEAKVPALDDSSDRGIHPELEALTLRALERDPDKRFQTAGEMGTALTAWLAKAGQPSGEAELAKLMQGVMGDRLKRKQALLEQAQTADVPDKDIPFIKPDTDIGLAWPSDSGSVSRPPVKVKATAGVAAERLGSAAEGARLNTTLSGSFSLPREEAVGAFFDPEEEAAKAEQGPADGGSAPPVVGTLEAAPPKRPASRPAWVIPVIGLAVVAVIGVGLVFTWPILFGASGKGDDLGPTDPISTDAGTGSADAGSVALVDEPDGGQAEDGAVAAAADENAAEPGPPMPGPDEAWLTIQSTPDDCGVRLNKKLIKRKTPVVDLKVEPDKELAVTVFCRRYRYQKVRVTPKSGERLTLAFNPEPK